MKNNPFRDSPKKPFYQQDDDQDDDDTIDLSLDSDNNNEYQRLNVWFDREYFRPNFFHTK